MPAKSTPPTREELDAAWADLQSRIFQCFTQLVWIVDVKPRLQGPVPKRSKLVSNATVESTLLAVRDIDDFFSANPGRGDDIRAKHFGGYIGTGRFLTDPEREGINKKLVHLTYQVVRERMKAPEGHNPRQWDAADLVERAMKSVLPFLDFLERDFFADDDDMLDDIRAARRGVGRYLRELQALAEEERRRFGD